MRNSTAQDRRIWGEPPNESQLTIGSFIQCLYGILDYNSLLHGRD